MTMLYNYCDPVPDTRILFKDLILDNSADIKTYMIWENYTMNETVIPVIELLKDHALIALTNSYGLFHVEQDIVEQVCADVFINFPTLMQQLAISRLMDAYAVVKDDENTDTLTRTEILDGEVNQNSELRVGTTNTDTNLLATQQKTTGTVLVENDLSNTQNSTTNIDNSSGVQATGNRNVNLTHNMPEQSIAGTGNFPVDPQGTPILTTSFVQGAAENFNTSNPINTTESSEQIILNTNTGNNDSTTTNDVTVADSGTTTRTQVNSGADNSDSITLTDNTNTTNETRTSIMTNKQYAYEIKAFLDSTETLNAFRNWENQFAWVVGII